jgi:diguanylate cyclase (GGDEF) domain
LKSIRGKFLQLNLISILLCVALIGGLGIWSVSVIQADSSQKILGLTCRIEGHNLNDAINSIQDSVNLFYELTDGTLPSVESLRDQQFVDAFYEKAENNMGQIARITHGVCAYYFRNAPELTAVPEGFFYGKRPDSELIEKEPLTDLSVFDPSDTEHVGWYYQPQIAGRPIWMEPYFNQNLDIYMVSYVIPFFRNGVFWGIAGMDIDFDVVIRNVRAIKPYSTGYAFLCSDEGVIYYHPELPIGSRVTDHCAELAPLLEAFSAENSGEENSAFRYKYKGVEKTLTFYRLNNGMELVLVVENSEIRAPMAALFYVIILVALMLCVAVILVIIPISNRITQPLEYLTRAARKIALGNLDVELPDPGGDEVGILTRSFEVTVSSLKQYVASMNNMAFTDPLTHVKNKTAYDRAVLGLQEDIENGQAEFGLAMFDLNDLKYINDNYGHEHGDEYIVACCNLICGVFKRSPVFRVGGDEFIVILSGEDLKDRDELIRHFEAEMEKSRAEDEPWKRLSVAKGVAVYSQGDATPEDVFNRADREMYADKRIIKGISF